MASPAVSKDMDFPQTQEVRWGYTSDRMSWREAAVETTSSLSDRISGSTGNSMTYISFRPTSVTFHSTPWAKVKSTDYFDKPFHSGPLVATVTLNVQVGCYTLLCGEMGRTCDFLERVFNQILPSARQG